MKLDELEEKLRAVNKIQDNLETINEIIGNFDGVKINKIMHEGTFEDT
jgi:hypothetical protein